MGADIYWIDRESASENVSLLLDMNDKMEAFLADAKLEGESGRQRCEFLELTIYRIREKMMHELVAVTFRDNYTSDSALWFLGKTWIDVLQESLDSGRRLLGGKEFASKILAGLNKKHFYPSEKKIKEYVKVNEGILFDEGASGNKEFLEKYTKTMKAKLDEFWDFLDTISKEDDEERFKIWLDI